MRLPIINESNNTRKSKMHKLGNWSIVNNEYEVIKDSIDDKIIGSIYNFYSQKYDITVSISSIRIDDDYSPDYHHTGTIKVFTHKVPTNRTDIHDRYDDVLIDYISYNDYKKIVFRFLCKNVLDTMDSELTAMNYDDNNKISYDDKLELTNNIKSSLAKYITVLNK